MKKQIIWILAVALLIIIPTFSNAEFPDDDDTFTIVWLSDTQDMSYHGYDHAMQKMGIWIIDQKEKLDIKYIVQTGDMVDNGASHTQWEQFDEMYYEFKGKIPYISAAGNHEVKKNGYLDYCMRPEIRTIPRDKSFFRGQCSFCTLVVNDTKLIIIAIGFGVDQDAIKWVNTVLKLNKDYSAILLIHDYLLPDGRFTINGKSIFKQVVTPNDNVRLVLCGHELGVSSRIDKIDDNGDGIFDRNVTQLMYNYQHFKDECGQMRTIQFDTFERSITVSTYSPVTKRYYRDWMFGDNYTFTIKNAY